MEPISVEQFENLEELLKSKKPGGPSVVNGYTATGNYRSLLKPSNTTVKKISRDVRAVELSKPTYLQRIDVIGPNVEKLLTGLSVVAIKADGSRVQLQAKRATFTENGSPIDGVVFKAGVTAVALEAHANKTYFSVHASRIRIVGYDLDQLDVIAKRLSDLENITEGIGAYVAAQKKEVADAKSAKAALDSEIAERTESLEELRQSHAEATSAYELIDSKNDAERTRQKKLEHQATELREKLESLGNNESQLRQSVEELNKAITIKQNELAQLETDRNLISDEYRDYVSEGKQQSRLYAWFLYFSIAVIAACAIQLLSGAARILDAHVTTIDDVLALTLQRLPFAAALTAIVGLSWRLAELFVSRIMAIHAQRLALARLLVIAKDTVYSSSSGLNLTNEQKFRERIRLKLAMLKSHLTSELGRDFDFAEPVEEDIPQEVRVTVDEELQRASGEASH